MTETGGPYTRELSAAVDAAREAGKALMALRGEGLEVRRKEDQTLVTTADTTAEGMILGSLRKLYPGDAIFSEEAGCMPGRGGPLPDHVASAIVRSILLGKPDAPAQGSALQTLVELSENSGRVWIIDPLDGTTNYSRGLPFFAVSIALWEKGKPVTGVVYLPVFDELFAAAAEEPATLNGQPIQVAPTESVREAMVNIYFDRHTRLRDGLEVLGRVASACEGRVKNMGSTASMLCYVACGRLDAFVKNNTKLWDFAAGALVLSRAGGRLTDFGEQPLVRSDQSLLATNGKLHKDLGRVVRGE